MTSTTKHTLGSLRMRCPYCGPRALGDHGFDTDANCKTRVCRNCGYVQPIRRKSSSKAQIEKHALLVALSEKILAEIANEERNSK